MLLNQMGNHLANCNQVNLAVLYYKKAFEAEERVNILRKEVMKHEQLSNEKLFRQSAAEEVDEIMAGSE